MIEHFKNDKSTVFSIVPFEIEESKPGLFPGTFKLAACTDENKPERLVVGASELIMPQAESKLAFRTIQPSFTIAKSIVDDFLSGQLVGDSEAHPGICWVPGEVTVEVFKVQHKALHDEIKRKQRAWLVEVVKKTDDEWGKYHNHRVASDQAKYAVKVLGLPTPPWMTNEEIGLTFARCPACGTTNDPKNVICSNCRCILDKKRYEALSFA